VLIEGVVDLALHCMAWMVYPDLTLSEKFGMMVVVAGREKGGDKRKMNKGFMLKPLSVL